MEFTKSLLKEKLRLELHLLKQTPHGSIVSALQWTNQLLWPEQTVDPAIQKLHYAVANLVEKCKNFSEAERLNELNHYFFEQLDFKLMPDSTSPYDWLIEPVLTNKKGHPVLISLIFLVFAERLQLPLSLLNHQSLSLLKWTRPKESGLIDLSMNGAQLKTQQIIDKFKGSQFLSNDLEALNHNQAIKLYLNLLLDTLQKENESLQKLSLLDTLLNLEPSNLNYLGQRAILHKNLNQRKQAMSDLKRYFSYVEQQSSPDHIQNAYYELCLEPSPHNLIH